MAAVLTRMSPETRLWRGEPLILASRSPGRATILRNAGIPFEAIASELDERAFADHQESPVQQAQSLACGKARAVSALYPERLVLGADQGLALGDRVFHKPATPAAARDHLLALSGRTHHLHSAIAIVENGDVAFQHVSTAAVAFRAMSAYAIDLYVAAMDKAITQTVGAYEIEGLGANLIEWVEGDLFTVIGLPLFPLLDYFRTRHLMPV